MKAQLTSDKVRGYFWLAKMNNLSYSEAKQMLYLLFNEETCDKFSREWFEEETGRHFYSI